MEADGSWIETLVDLQVVPVFAYGLEPGPGHRAAGGYITVTRLASGQRVVEAAEILLVLESNQWRVISLGEPVAALPVVPSVECVSGPVSGQSTARFSYANPNGFPLAFAPGVESSFSGFMNLTLSVRYSG